MCRRAANPLFLLNWTRPRFVQKSKHRADTAQTRTGTGECVPKRVHGLCKFSCTLIFLMNNSIHRVREVLTNHQDTDIQVTKLCCLVNLTNKGMYGRILEGLIDLRAITEVRGDKADKSIKTNDS